MPEASLSYTNHEISFVSHNVWTSFTNYRLKIVYVSVTHDTSDVVAFHGFLTWHVLDYIKCVWYI
mgnify:CR=1 FL=1